MQWPLLLTLSGGIVALVSAVTVIMIKAFGFLQDVREEFEETNKQTRHSINSEIKQGRAAFESKLEEVAVVFNHKFDSLDARLRAVEREHALVMTLRTDFREYQSSISSQITALRQERRDDMRGLHSRLNDILMVPVKRHEQEEG